MFPRRIRWAGILLPLMFVILICAPSAFAASTGPNNPGTTASVNRSGSSHDWSPTDSAKTQDDSYAHAQITYMIGSDYLRATNFGFDIPANSIITGVKMEVDWYATNNSVWGGDIYLTKNGVQVGNNKYESIHPPQSDTDTYKVYGGAGDTWGVSNMTGGYVNSANFGVDVSMSYGSETSYDGYIDHIRVTVYYTPPPTVTITVGTQSCTGTDCPLPFGNCGYGLAAAGMSLSGSFVFSEVMQAGDFTLGDIIVTNGSVANLLTSDNQTYTVSITSSSSDALVSVSVADKAARSNATGAWSDPSGPLELPWGEDYFNLCELFLIDFIYWKLDESSGTVAGSAGYPGACLVEVCSGVEGTLNNILGSNWGQCGARGTALRFDGTDDFISTDFAAPWFFKGYSIWAKSNVAAPANQTLLQVIDPVRWDHTPFLTIKYRSDKSNYLYVTHDDAAAISSVAFDITKWNHIVVTINGGSIVGLLVNGQDALSATAMDLPYVEQENPVGDNVFVGAETHSGSTFSNFFNGVIDEVLVHPIGDAGTIEGYTAFTPATCGGSSIPVPIALSPGDNSTEISTTSDLLIRFGQTVSKNTGNIVIKKTSDNSTVQTVDITSGSVTLSTTLVTNDTVSIDISSLSAATGYYVQVAEGGFLSASGGRYAGMSDTTSWNFTTGGGTPSFIITPLPSASHTAVDATDGTDMHVTGKLSGTYTVRLSKNDTVIVDAVTSLTQNRDWSGIAADTSGSKVVVNFPAGQVGTHGHDASANPHTIYALKSLTTSFRVCPDATSLSGVTSSCSNGVSFTGPYPQIQSVSGQSVTVGTTTIGNVTYWYASGLVGSGGEGEGGEIVSVSAFSWWTLSLLLIGCTVVLYFDGSLLLKRS